LNSYLRWRWAIPLRKWLGLWAFAFAVLHLAVYLYSIELSDGVDWTLLLRQMATQVYLILGALSLLILSALALTSNQAAMRLLKQNWKRLHRLVYGAGAMVVIHALLSMRMSKKVIIRDPNALPELWLYLALMILLLALRIPAVKRALEEPSKRLRRGLAGERA
jgi:sulfoxide reductase heme-binding subunit YedZ